MSLLATIKRKIHNATHPKLGVVLMLHRVVEKRSEEPEKRELEITTEFLVETIVRYREQGYRFVSIDQVCNILNGKEKGKPFVCLTFDDGYQDNYTVALPLLKRLEVPFAIYVTTGFIDNRLPMWWYPDEQLGLSREELVALSKEPLCTIGAHTISHRRLDELTGEEQLKEIVESKRGLEEIIACPVNHFSYPHGAYNDATVNIVKENGFSSALMAWGGVVRKGDERFQLHRIILKQNQ
ncbi:MAG: polysaccharide deacetylase family protein [Bacteroidales bacterium]|nr:polysaccharide deacetylase family protein [Bacteroidales bacterium]